MYPKTRQMKVGLELLGTGLTHKSSLPYARTVQDDIGRLMEDRQAVYEDISLGGLPACYALSPRPEPARVILYLHGGGYTLGSLQYAKGFGSVLARSVGIKTLCLGYRLAPEHPYPAALEDALRAYRFLLAQGYAPRGILLCGEASGGGLCFALCLRLKEMGLPLPGGIIGISPWVDLTLSGSSYEKNRDKDPVLAKDTLRYYAECYAGGQAPALPHISPLFGNLASLPRCLLFVGGDELFLSEIYALHKSLILCGVQSHIRIAPHMWNAYLLYGGEAGKQGLADIAEFAREGLDTPAEFSE